MYNRYRWGLSTQFFAPIAASNSGDNTIVAAVGGRQIRVIKYSIVAAGAVVVTWKSSTAGAISGAMAFASNGGISEPEAEAGIMQTAVGEDLVLNLGAAVSVGGMVTYILV